VTTEWNDSPKSWGATPEHQWSLAIILQNHAFVFPWSQFLDAEGRDDEVRITFSTHYVVIARNHPSQFMADLSNQHLSALRQPVRAEMFGLASAAHITGITVRKVE
jgi:hypothetical protein